MAWILAAAGLWLHVLAERNSLPVHRMCLWPFEMRQCVLIYPHAVWSCFSDCVCKELFTKATIGQLGAPSFRLFIFIYLFYFLHHLLNLLKTELTYKSGESIESKKKSLYTWPGCRSRDVWSGNAASVRAELHYQRPNKNTDAHYHWFWLTGSLSHTRCERVRYVHICVRVCKRACVCMSPKLLICCMSLWWSIWQLLTTVRKKKNKTSD